MIKMTASVCVDAPVAEVWAVLSELEAIPAGFRRSGTRTVQLCGGASALRGSAS